jgi:hypothetical protein
MSKRMSLHCIVAVVVSLIAAAPARSSPSDISLNFISSAANADGRAEVLAIGKDGNLYHRWQVPAGWSFWTLLAKGSFADAALRLAADGRLYAFGIDNGQLAIFAQISRNGGWMADAYRTGDHLQKLSVALDSSGHFVVASLKDGGLWAIIGQSDQALAGSGWSDWTSLGGNQLKTVAAARDGDERVLIAALDASAQLQIIRQVSAKDSRWTRWQSLGTAKDGDLAMAMSPGRALWLFNTGQKQGLYARELAATGPAPEHPSLVTQVIGAQPVNHIPLATLVTPQGQAANVHNMGLDLLPLNDAWSAPAAVIDQQLFPIEGFAAQSSASGTFDLFAAGTHFVAEDSGAPANRVTLFTGQQDNGWPESNQILPGSQKVSIFSRLAAAHGGGGSDALFALDRGTGRVFVLTRSGNDPWKSSQWVRLGRVPGPTSPDLAFQATSCLEDIVKDEAASLRGQISSGVTDNLKAALAGSSVGDLVNDVNAMSICTPHGEALGVWLDGEANPDALIGSAIIPSGNSFAVLLPQATLLRAADEIWGKTPKFRTFKGMGVSPNEADVELKSYTFTLEPTDTLVLDIFGWAHALSLNIKGEVRAKFFAQGGLPGCTVSVNTDVDPPWLRKFIEGIATTFFMALPDNYFNGLLSGGSTAQAGELCSVSTAFVSDLYLPLPQGKARAPQILQIRYSGLQVQKDVGLIGFGQDLQPPRDRKPAVALSLSPMLAGPNRIRVKFDVTSTDMKLPGTVKWLPSDPQAATRVLQPADLNRDTSQDMASVFEYEVAPSNVARSYHLGAMTSEVTGADGIEMDDTQSVDLFIRPR